MFLRHQGNGGMSSLAIFQAALQKFIFGIFNLGKLMGYLPCLISFCVCVCISTSFIFCLLGERLKPCFGSIIQLTGSCDLRCDSILSEEVSRNMFDTLTLLRGDPRNG